MRIAEVIGKVTLNRCHPSFRGANLKLVTPLMTAQLDQDALDQDGLDQDGLDQDGARATEILVAWDELGAGLGSYIALSEGPEAAQPFRPEIKPVDAYAAAILDDLNMETWQKLP